MNFVLIRHTRLRGHEGLCYGQTEIPLAETFEVEALDLITRLPWKPARVYTSPLLRCRALAERVAGEAQVTVDQRLAELHFGAWEGKPWNELHGPEVDAWMAKPFEARPPGGETVPEFVKRVSEVRREILGGEHRPRDRIAIVTHAGVIRVWRNLETGAALEETFSQPVPHGCVWAGAF